MFDDLSADLRAKLDRCSQILRKLGKVTIAYSGGVDSSFLLAYALHVLGKDNVLAATAISPAQPQRERQSAVELAAQLGATLVQATTNELANPAFAANPPDRCYLCKSDVFGALLKAAGELGFGNLVSGANVDDASDYRPGAKAAAEMGVTSPLAEAGMTKPDIRAASKAMGLPTWNKPSMACLASRVPYGQQITAERLGRIERGEDFLRDLGFAQCRVRDHDAVARIEVPPADLPRLVELSAKIVPALKALGYKYVAADLQGFRSGAMNEVL